MVDDARNAHGDRERPARSISDDAVDELNQVAEEAVAVGAIADRKRLPAAWPALEVDEDGPERGGPGVDGDNGAGAGLQLYDPWRPAATRRLDGTFANVPGSRQPPNGTPERGRRGARHGRQRPPIQRPARTQDVEQPQVSFGCLIFDHRDRES